jgi:hypothetical protein
MKEKALFPRAFIPILTLDKVPVLLKLRDRN